MATSRQTPRVWSDAIWGSEILANWVKLGANAVVLWLSIGVILGGVMGGFWFIEGTTSLDRKLWLHHVRNGLGIGGRIVDLSNPNGGGDRIHVPKEQVQRYTHRSFEAAKQRFQASLFLGFLLAVGGTATAASWPVPEWLLGHRRSAYPRDGLPRLATKSSSRTLHLESCATGAVLPTGAVDKRARNSRDRSGEPRLNDRTSGWVKERRRGKSLWAALWTALASLALYRHTNRLDRFSEEDIVSQGIAAFIAVTDAKTRRVFCIVVLCLLCISLQAAGQIAGQVTFVNSCKYSLTLYSSGPALDTLAPGGRKSIAISAFQQGGANLVIPYPNLSDDQCPNCDGWTDLGGPPGATQREGWMWMGNDAKYAAYCNPGLSGRGICALQRNCCGKGMVQDGTFGTHWEFTPRGTPTNDFVNLSTNYGSGPHSPPKLCGQPGVDPNDCVAKAANIFYNVPIEWTTNLDCSFTTEGTKVKGSKCFSVDCPDAYQHPTDDKQVACSADPGRWYVVTYCPGGSSMPNP